VRCDALVAANGKEALERLSSKPTPDVMLLLAMPVIIVTGLGIANLEWARSLGAAGLVRKPVEVEHLKGELIRVLA
jgi:CheY-like chemotaxis protein